MLQVRHVPDELHAVLRQRAAESGLSLSEYVLRELQAVAARPSADNPSLVLDDPEKRASVERAYAKIAPMFWGPRIPLDEACAVIREWVAALRG